MNRVVVFRVDASLQMGTGHVMRCLTLADALRVAGAKCEFICRAHPGNLLDLIRSQGYITHELAVVQDRSGADVSGYKAESGEQSTAHGDWLGASQAEDAAACEPIVAKLHPDWLVVDHYALDARWEQALKHHCHRLMVIDDLADRSHVCDLLLDQTFGRQVKDYRARIPGDCQLLCGSQYALLRPEFAAQRPYSLQRRVKPQLRQLLISMGGVDKDNATGRVLEALRGCPLPDDCRITVNMGSTAPWLSEVKQQAISMPWATEVLVGVSDMARLMADSDLAIGAAGATSWERCCLGLPTIMLVLADNQRQVAQGLEQSKAARIIEKLQDIGSCLPDLLRHLTQHPASLQFMSRSARRIVDGRGVNTVVHLMESLP
ncbi:UDP-2,4-diacetamido-2,4,6-trideoxy-beta-L-altropyranose hydrolase [Stutzerimonas frequens]|uniref:UDP-2,4-diacetamido-2,4, 6-trideoxy-beta-L-altropyranose hydrolase n=1 Tax=Stutzerimonas frequens TaxID=2968969 RepID=UPI0029350352|nr:UDP-2,4-diacetamido-2,4,6-trideoxy-beta-L-altropyranose hydrolase [Stutzerimonas frequens]WOC78303.1 UDP-2,4-diacetamido-2,4,6-trideoxy-beta-L-altropyranose hydrolase [Stutzerimonas frequens]